VVNGNADIRTLLARLLALEGFAVEVACDPNETLAKTALQRPDLIILACHLWCDDALSVLTQLRAEAPESCVLVFTEDDGIKPCEHRATFLSKFAPVSDLLAKVSELTTKQVKSHTLWEV
jgi:DNA-binding response OmpR family regulator